MRTVRLTKESTKDILENLLKRSPNNYGKFEAAVADILANVKEKGDEALFSYTKEFDKVEVTADTIRVTEAEIQEAYEAVDASLLEVIRKALVNIRSYHEKQRQNSWFTSTENGTMLGQKVTPLNRVGVYVPGGKAVYPSSVLMNIVPAKVAGVPHIVMTTPPGKDGKVNPSTLVAAKEAHESLHQYLPGFFESLLNGRLYLFPCFDLCHAETGTSQTGFDEAGQPYLTNYVFIGNRLSLTEQQRVGDTHTESFQILITGKLIIGQCSRKHSTARIGYMKHI